MACLPSIACFPKTFHNHALLPPPQAVSPRHNKTSVGPVRSWGHPINKHWPQHSNDDTHPASCRSSLQLQSGEPKDGSRTLHAILSELFEHRTVCSHKSWHVWRMHEIISPLADRVNRWPALLLQFAVRPPQKELPIFRDTNFTTILNQFLCKCRKLLCRTYSIKP